QHDRALVGHLDRAARPARAAEDLDAELGLEPLDLLRDGGLRQIELRARARERAVAGDRVDRSQVAQLHADPSWRGVRKNSKRGLRDHRSVLLMHLRILALVRSHLRPLAFLGVLTSVALAACDSGSGGGASAAPPGAPA